MASVDLEDLRDALMFVSASEMFDVGVYVSLETGRIYYTGGENFGEEFEPAPGDVDDPEQYAALPDSRALGLGRDVALAFIERVLPGRLRQVEDMFRRRGAFRRFKDMLIREGLIDRWHAFETEAEIAALREWCEEVGLEIEGSPAPAPAPESQEEALPETGLRCRVRLRSDRETVWWYLDSPEGRAAFWAQAADERDNAIHFAFAGGDSLEAPILERRPPECLALRYFGGSPVRITLDPWPGGGTCLTVTEPDPPAAEREDQARGWIAWALMLKAAADYGIDLRNQDPQAGWREGFADGQ